MISQIFTRTPIWVWALLLGLIFLGYVQSKPRVMGLTRLMIIPIVLTVLSVLGTISAFGLSAQVLLVWLLSAALTAGLVLQLQLPANNWFDAQTQEFNVAGSWVPLALMMGIFINKYAVGVATSINPELARNGLFALCFTAIYGAFSGAFIGRAVRLWRLSS